ncbi:MAG TPA: leucine--tRNA ligase [Candidatus Moranbacteria bacterium]|nr:leucine--tRNA ligase [Candidatus Moranbacteria bacterium]HAT74525.1 leucine--tRNA ligase [Candidatus Moranbacteria bacterium]
MEKYEHKKIEEKWSRKWIDERVFTPDLKNSQNPYYALFMFPYPSAEGLHIGNFYAFTCVDVMAKYKKLKGFDVFEPIGWDAFGIHSENYALKIGEAPGKMLERTVANFTKQIQAAGLSCDWTREVNTMSPEYYKWTQWIFTQLFEKGLAYQKEAYLNWCPSCKTVLADEQIEGGECERCKNIPEKRKMKQWFFKITHYADRLLDGLGKMDWSEITKSAQKNWIGKSEGANIKFKVANSDLEFEIFTTRPDTLFGCTYCVLSPEHELVSKIISDKQKDAVEKYIQEAGIKSEIERKENKEKTGVFSGAYAVNPANQEKVPIWIADYVLAGYGFGSIMAVPAHDERDFEFAKKFNLEIREVIAGGDINKEAYVEEGNLVSSGKFSGVQSIKAKKVITEFVGGKLVANYKLRDWCISRQRYWGPPVPVVYCEKCGTVAVPEKDLPVVLPEMEKNWEPSGDGKGPLAKVESFMKTVCPRCGGEARREADVMDNFLDSAWYFFRYLSPDNNKEIFSKDLGGKWLPVDLYIGGNEHAVLHLMYTRFITMALHDLGLIDFDNPFKRFRANGMILKNGKKMSKSKGNVINPEEYGEKVGYDALKSYILFLGPLSEDRSFSDEGIMGTKRWAERIFNLFDRVDGEYTDEKKVLRKLHRTIKNMENDMEEQKYNTAIAKLMEMTNVFYETSKISEETFKKFLILVAIFLPALAEELWEKLGHTKSIFKEKWPEYDPALIQDEEINLVIQVNGKIRDIIRVNADISEEEAREAAIKSEKIKKYTAEKEIKKIIFVKSKLINIVV